jgi:hypothetical protein
MAVIESTPPATPTTAAPARRWTARTWLKALAGAVALALVLLEVR